MAGKIECKVCGFDLAGLPATFKVQKAEEDLTCPFCASAVSLSLPALGILVRGSGKTTTFARWKLSARDDQGRSFRVDRLTLTFEALGSIEPREVCYPKVPVFLQEDGRLVLPPLPLRAEYFDCIDAAGLRELLERGPLGELVGSQYQLALPLRGLGEPERFSLQVLTPFPGPPGKDNAFGEINVRVWPNLGIAEWKYYLVGLAGAGPVGEKTMGERRLRARVLPAGGGEWLPVDGVQRAGGSLVRLLEARPDWLSLEVVDPLRGDGDPAAVQGGGLFPVPTTRGHALGNVRLGLDFGTSNSCAACEGHMTRSQTAPEMMPGVEETAYNLYLLRGGPEHTAPAGPDLWPSCRGFGAYGDLIPSELLFTRPKVDLSASLAGIAGWRFGRDFGIPGAGILPRFSEAEYCLGDFKWQDMLRASSPLFAAQIVDLQAHYLTGFLMSAYVRAAVASGRAAAVVDVLYSYPMAFSGTDLTNLSSAVALAAQRLGELTGISWSITQGVDESTAAAKNAGETDANVLVYLDMGGGSTDVGVKLELGSTRWQTVYLTSVAYAGSALLESYVGKQDSKTGKHLNSCLSGKTTIDVLRRKVRESKNSKDVLGDYTLFNRSLERVVQNRTNHFYAYLDEYIARLIAAGFLDQRFKSSAEGTTKFLPEVKIAFFFLGNGWNFASATASDIAAVLSEAIFHRAIQLLRQEKSEYAAEVRRSMKGMAISPTVGTLRDVPHAKAAVALGVLRGSEGPVAAGGGQRAAIVGWPTRVGEREVPWFAYYTTAGSGGPVPPGEAGAVVRPAGGTVVIMDEAEEESAPASPTPWYDRLPSTARLDWPRAQPGMPEGCEHPHDLDENLNGTRGILRQQCAVHTNGWFAKGAYEVMLEQLFKQKLPEII